VALAGQHRIEYDAATDDDLGEPAHLRRKGADA